MRLYYYRWKMALLAGLMGIAVLSTGCSRSTMNYQLAESLGTVGKYENNEPVETPKMEQERLQRESEEAKEAGILEYLNGQEFTAHSVWFLPEFEKMAD